MQRSLQNHHIIVLLRPALPQPASPDLNSYPEGLNAYVPSGELRTSDSDSYDCGQVSGLAETSSPGRWTRLLREQRLFIVIPAVLTVAVAFALSVSQRPIYAATAYLSFQDQSQSLALLGVATAQLQLPQERAAQGAQVVTRPDVLLRAREVLKNGYTLNDLEGKISATVQPATNLVMVTAHADSADSASRLANAVARSSVAIENREARTRFRDAAKAAATTVKDPATRALNLQRASQLRTLGLVAEPVLLASAAISPKHAASPRPIRNAVLGGILGLLLGFGLAFVRDSRDRGMRGSDDIERELRLPLLGHVRDVVMGTAGQATKGRPIPPDGELEAFRILRTNLAFLHAEHESRTIVVTSPLSGEGKSTVAASLAASAAIAGQRTLLLECDLRRPSLAARIGIDRNTRGLVDVLMGEASPADVVQTVDLTESPPTNGRRPDVASEREVGVLHCMIAGSRTAQPAELLGSDRLKELIRQGLDRYDTVILDSSPLLPVVDTLEIVPLVDCVLICVRDAQTTRNQALAAKAALERLPSRPTAVVVTGLKAARESYFGYYGRDYSYAG